jgi:hypothetical protein
MILLRPDCLVFKTAAGENIPCSAEDVTVELMGDSAQWSDQEIIKNAAAAVLHYFRSEKQQDFVSVAEFSETLERVLRGFGLAVASCDTKPSVSAPEIAPRVVEADLRRLAEESGIGSELCFFQSLRAGLRRQLDGTPVVFRYRGLRSCVQWLAGAKRWSGRCQTLNDQIVDYLRHCLTAENIATGCGLVVS